MTERRRQDLYELASRLGVSPLQVVSWVAEGMPCYTAEGERLDPLTTAQELANHALGTRIRAARTEADFTTLCLEIEGAAEAGDLPRPRAQVLIDQLSGFASAARRGFDASRSLGRQRQRHRPPQARNPGDVVRKLTAEELATLLGLRPGRVRTWLRQGCPCERDDKGRPLLDAAVVTRWRSERLLASLGPGAAARAPFPALSEEIRGAESFEGLSELAKKVAAGLCCFTVSVAQGWALNALLLEAHVRLLRERVGGPGREKEAS